ncbi:Universal stress protein A-like protein [Acorus calamus]|uniref:Universal stress protein A-like protein n=1 Tax=Acorus calamus TaxID=4465 RepID=A0AAV9EEX9_ACOCL|nr:Universal stress protein A-like protein [Acorus calamus]
MRVVVAIDESELSFYALTWAIDHLCGLSSAVTGEVTLFLVHGQTPAQTFIFPAGPGNGLKSGVYAMPTVVDSVKKAQDAHSAALLAKAFEVCKHRLVKAETLVLEGDPKEVICQAVEQVNADLLVVGSRGLGKIKRAFLGSVSDYCAHHAKCPVLIVKPHK